MKPFRNTRKARGYDHDVNGPPISRWEGRLFGGSVLSAFLLYGVGSRLGNESIGLTLVAGNSVAVTVAGVIGYRLLRDRDPRAGSVYLSARIAEATLLGAGFGLHTIAGVSGAATTGYLLAMTTLGLGSLPFWNSVRREGWLSNGFALWGIAGYLALAVGAVTELTTGPAVATTFAVPGGLFEVAVGFSLLRRGFRSHPSPRTSDTVSRAIETIPASAPVATESPMGFGS